jgi:hypothetical protein
LSVNYLTGESLTLFNLIRWWESECQLAGNCAHLCL